MKLMHPVGLISAALFMAVACGSTGSSASAPPASPSEHAMMHHVALDVASSRFGEVLVDGQGRVLYLFAADTTSSSTCFDACATAWPPLITDKGATVDAMHMATAALTGTTPRKDGSVQVTYNGHPLYYFKGDTQPGQITCQAVVNFGAAWYVVDAHGNAITKS